VNFAQARKPFLNFLGIPLLQTLSWPKVQHYRACGMQNASNQNDCAERHVVRRAYSEKRDFVSMTTRTKVRRRVGSMTEARPHCVEGEVLGLSFDLSRQLATVSGTVQQREPLRLSALLPSPPVVRCNVRELLSLKHFPKRMRAVRWIYGQAIEATAEFGLKRVAKFAAAGRRRIGAFPAGNSIFDVPIQPAERSIYIFRIVLQDEIQRQRCFKRSPYQWHCSINSRLGEQYLNTVGEFDEVAVQGQHRCILVLSAAAVLVCCSKNANENPSRMIDKFAKQWARETDQLTGTSYRYLAVKEFSMGFVRHSVILAAIPV
jgi:hypothetical protein